MLDWTGYHTVCYSCCDTGEVELSQRQVAAMGPRLAVVIVLDELSKSLERAELNTDLSSGEYEMRTTSHVLLDLRRHQHLAMVPMFPDYSRVSRTQWMGKWLPCTL